MRVLISTLFIIIFCPALLAQTKLPPVDKSPMDVSYYPANYPVLKIQDKISEPLVARVLYSRPQKNGRTLFGDLIEYGKIWRLGANEATEIEFFQPVKIGNTKIKKGRYSLYCIPYTDKWTIIINKDTDSWGAFKYSEANDVGWIDVPVQKQNESLEFFAMAFEKSATGANLIIAWDDVRTTVPISFH